MALESRGDNHYGDCQDDIREELAAFSTANAYPVDHFADAVCLCNGTTFRLLLDDVVGVAIRVCHDCGHRHAMGDSSDYLDDAEPRGCECTCGADTFEVTIGVALYRDSEDVKWLYVGCRCVTCGQTGCYGDWKNEHIGYRDFLARI